MTSYKVLTRRKTDGLSNSFHIGPISPYFGALGLMGLPESMKCALPSDEGASNNFVHNHAVFVRSEEVVLLQADECKMSACESLFFLTKSICCM